MADAALRDLERRAATTDDPADREALARARLRAGLEPGDWVHAERDWAEDPTLERLDVLAQLAERYAKIPAALVKMVVSRPMQGQRLRTRHGDGLCVGNAPRRIRLDDGTERNFSRSAISNRVLDPVTWLTTHKGGKRWARGWLRMWHGSLGATHVTLEELATAAQEAIDTRARMRAEMGEAFASPARMMLVLSRPEPRGERVRLAGRYGPLGGFVASPSDGEVLADFDAAEVLAWATKQQAARNQAERERA